MNTTLHLRRPRRAGTDPVTAQLRAEAGQLLYERPHRWHRPPPAAVVRLCPGTLYYHAGGVPECTAGRLCPSMAATHAVQAACRAGKCARDGGECQAAAGLPRGEFTVPLIMGAVLLVVLVWAVFG